MADENPPPVRAVGPCVLGLHGRRPGQERQANAGEAGDVGILGLQADVMQLPDHLLLLLVVDVDRTARDSQSGHRQAPRGAWAVLRCPPALAPAPACWPGPAVMPVCVVVRQRAVVCQAPGRSWKIWLPRMIRATGGYLYFH